MILPASTLPEVVRLIVLARVATMRPATLRRMRLFLEEEMKTEGALKSGTEANAARMTIFLLKAAEREAETRGR